MPSKHVEQIVRQDSSQQDHPTIQGLLTYRVATGGELINAPDVVPRGITYQLSRSAADQTVSVLVMDLGDSRWETETLLRMLTDSLTSIRGQRSTEVVLVVSTSQPAVSRVVSMLATALDVTLYLTPAADRLAEAKPVGRVTPTDLESLSTLRDLGGRVTASQFAEAASIEPTAAGNRLSKQIGRAHV